MTYQQGNTIKFKAEFKNWGTDNVDPESVKFIIYDSRYNKLNEFIIGTANRLDIGSFYFDHIFDVAGEYIYEWYAIIDSLPSLQRNKVLIKRL